MLVLFFLERAVAVSLGDPPNDVSRNTCSGLVYQYKSHFQVFAFSLLGLALLLLLPSHTYVRFFLSGSCLSLYYGGFLTSSGRHGSSL